MAVRESTQAQAVRGAAGDAVNLEEFEGLARARLDAATFAYFAGGAGDEQTIRSNREAFGMWQLRPRMLTGVWDVDLSATMLGIPVRMPVGVAPMALQGLAHPEGELGMARAAGRSGVVIVASTLSSRSYEEIAAAASGPVWFQLYVQGDRGFTKELVTRAVEAGSSAIVLTVDVPVSGYRDGEVRHRFHVPPGGLGNFMAGGGNDPLISFVADRFDPTLTWSDLEWIRTLSNLPLVVKGVLDARDAELAVAHGAAAVVVSNHGGRQLDHSPASIDVLEEVMDAVGADCEVYLDSGVRRGTDVLVALGLGATAVFVGRPFLFALASAGQAGVERALAILRAEMVNAMTLLGLGDVRSIRNAGRSWLGWRRQVAGPGSARLGRGEDR